MTAAASYFLRPSDDIGIQVADGVDELALALSADAYSATLRSRVHALAQTEAPVRTRNGLLLVPDAIAGQGKAMDWILPAFGATPSARMLDRALIEADHGHAIAIQTARQLVMFIKRAGGQSQFSVPLAAQARDDGNFAALHAWIASHIDEDLGVARLAEMANMSLRTFVRVYTATVGRTPAKTVEAIRMEAACRALESSTLPLKAICLKIGYAEEQTLRRVFLRNFGVNPLQYRARFSERAAAGR
ncbi:helix-turn-helix domain-containing protein [Massilia atriviolacea]|uniref:Helix-turn-helix domain-containing protein n=1 Tax=Massilia atriviolacea TaxID=2495579 RepID=A0A430HH98_9BURK|nr:helix-turn-helix domain-containing protein [Massilia atriviolacea]